MRYLLLSACILSLAAFTTRNPASLFVVGADHGKVTKAVLKTSSFPTFVVDNHVIQPRAYTVYITGDGPDIVTKVEGAKPDANLRRVLAKVKEGSVITLSDVEYNYENDSYSETLVLEDEIKMVVKD